MYIPITNLTVSENVTLITLINIPSSQGNIAKIFLALANNNINVDMISQTSPLKGTVNISFTFSDNEVHHAIQALKQFKKNIPTLRIEVNSNNTKLSLYGEGMKTTPGVAAKTLEILAENDIDIIMITTSEIDISYLIYASDQNKAIQLFNNVIKNNGNI